jgi:hypothetical protein
MDIYKCPIIETLGGLLNKIAEMTFVTIMLSFSFLYEKKCDDKKIYIFKEKSLGVNYVLYI